jgi:DUF4097 and DUF4098 domain-containing protein YvlB
VVAGTPEVVRVQGRASLRVSSDSGRVAVVAEDRPDVLVDRGVVATADDDPRRLQVAGGSGVDVRVPLGTDVVVGAGSGRVQLKGPLGSVSVTADSGRVDIERAERVDVRVSSGRIDIGHCDGPCRVISKSGRATIGTSGATDVMVVSGAIVAHRVGGPAQLKTTSGRIDVTMSGAFDVEAESVSGRIRITVPPDVHPDVAHSSSGRTSVGVEPGSDVTIRARSVSGRLEIRPGRGR